MSKSTASILSRARSFDQSVWLLLCSAVQMSNRTQRGASDLRSCGSEVGIPVVRRRWCHLPTAVVPSSGRRQYYGVILRQSAEVRSIVGRTVSTTSREERQYAASPGRVLPAVVARVCPRDHVGASSSVCDSMRQPSVRLSFL